MQPLILAPSVPGDCILTVADSKLVDEQFAIIKKVVVVSILR